MTRAPKLLVLAFDPLTEAMPGPAIRAWHLAEELAHDHPVVLATTAAATRTHPKMDVQSAAGSRLEHLVAWADAIVAPISVVRRHPVVADAAKPLCIDMYIPTHLENLEPFGEAGGEEHQAAVAHQVAVTREDFRRGDFFLCASERQRDFWLGYLAAVGRVNPTTYDDDPTLRRLIDVVPFGLPTDPPAGDRPRLREAFPAIGPEDPVAIWGGGVYNWFDPLSLVRAIDELRATVPTIRLVFLGMRNPNPDIPEMRVAAALRQLSDQLGLTGLHVFFNEGWVPYELRAGYLLDAQVAVSTHLAHVETHFSFRTRVLDYLWVGLPMVLTGGDALSEEIGRLGLGITVPPGDPNAIANALAKLITSPPDRAAIRRYGERYRWDRVTEPLTAWSRHPRRARDLAGRGRPR
jgi:glycosyltransferase involved in cell wall biosynthesis